MEYFKDLDEERNDQCNSWFRKEIMNVLKQPYTETELIELHREATVHRESTRNVELENGTEFSFPMKKKERPSYLDGYPGKLPRQKLAYMFLEVYALLSYLVEAIFVKLKNIT